MSMPRLLLPELMQTLFSQRGAQLLTLPSRCIHSLQSTTASATLNQAASIQGSATPAVSNLRQLLASRLSVLGSPTAPSSLIPQQPVTLWHSRVLAATPRAASHTSQPCVRQCLGVQQQHHTWRCFSSQPQPKQQATAAELGMYGAAAAIGMIGFAYAAVPLYKVFCAATGYGGTVAGATTVEEKLKKRAENPNPEVEEAAAQREVTVWFNADVADDMPWEFKPTQDCVRVRPGQSTLAFFTAKNKSAQAITGYSVYNVAPDKAAQYFNKIQCFCFEEQRLRAGETVDMPVFFYLDPEMAADWNCRNVNDITLSYVFHKVDDADLEDEDEEDNSQPSGVKLHGPGLAPLPAGSAAAILQQQQQQHA